MVRECCDPVKRNLSEKLGITTPFDEEEEETFICMKYGILVPAPVFFLRSKENVGHPWLFLNIVSIFGLLLLLLFVFFQPSRVFGFVSVSVSASLDGSCG